MPKCADRQYAAWRQAADRQANQYALAHAGAGVLSALNNPMGDTSVLAPEAAQKIRPMSLSDVFEV